MILFQNYAILHYMEPLAGGNCMEAMTTEQVGKLQGVASWHIFELCLLIRRSQRIHGEWVGNKLDI